MSTVVLPGVIEPVALIFKLNNGMVARGLDGLSDDEVWRQPPGGGNPIAWLLGHLAETRAHLLIELGHKHETGLGSLFDRAAVLRAPSVYPPRSVIEAAWNDTRGRMRDAFAALTEQRLAGPAARALPGARTLADEIAFFAFHECYHVGQIGFVRKQLGCSPIAD